MTVPFGVTQQLDALIDARALASPGTGSAHGARDERKPQLPLNFFQPPSHLTPRQSKLNPDAPVRPACDGPADGTRRMKEQTTS